MKNEEFNCRSLVMFDEIITDGLAEKTKKNRIVYLTIHGAVNHFKGEVISQFGMDIICYDVINCMFDFCKESSFNHPVNNLVRICSFDEFHAYTKELTSTGNRKLNLELAKLILAADCEAAFNFPIDNWDDLSDEEKNSYLAMADTAAKFYEEK